MRRPDCNRTYDDLKAFLDDELAPLRRWSVARHLAVCAQCRQEVKEMARIAEEIRPQQDDTLDGTDKQRLVSAMASSVAATGPIGSGRPRRALIFVTASAAFLVLAAAIVFPIVAPTRGKARQLSYSSLVGEEDHALEAQRSGPDVGAGNGPVSATAESEPLSPNNGRPDSSRTGGTLPVDSNGFQSPTMDASGSKSASRDGFVAQNQAAVSGSAVPETPSPSNIPSDDQSAAAPERQVHKSATITVQLADPESGGERVEDIAKTAGGFVTTSDLTTSVDGIKSYALAVKVPLPQFESTLAQIAKLGSVQDKEVTGEDITEQVSDADQREAVLEQDMDQALDQLKKKGMHASWDLQEDARDLRIQLAQSRARLQLLRGLAELSEIDVTLSQPPKPAPAVQTGFFADLSDSGHGALQSAASAVVTLIALLLWILAYTPLWLPVLLIGRWLWRRYSAGEQRTVTP